MVREREAPERRDSAGVRTDLLDAGRADCAREDVEPCDRLPRLMSS